jgi:hypothetical protein
MPDIDCDGTRLYELLREGRFILLTREPYAGAAPETVRVAHAPALTGPAMVLVRPDGYVALAGDRPAPAIAEWCRTAPAAQDA